ncbi:MAG TPA: hypothetical protein VIV66_05850 [Pyrinomonadaceae bacterium]
MRIPRSVKIVVWSVMAVCAVTLAFAAHSRNLRKSSSSPAVVIWAWERPENLDFIDPWKIGVAFLAKTITLESDRVSSRPRLQPLTFPAGTVITAVVRIESDRSHAPTLSNLQLLATAKHVSDLARLPNVSAVQIDFDATLSERDFYRALILKVREQLPKTTQLSITALASWCQGDDWLSPLPIDEAVPMLFRMGIERRQILSQLESGSLFRSRRCQSSAGVSTDERFSFNIQGKRLYIFNPQPWSPESLHAALETYDK